MEHTQTQDRQTNETSEQARQAIAVHREAIDALDAQLIALLNERAKHSITIRGHKKVLGADVFDPTREEAILERLAATTEGPMSGDDVREVYATILKVMKEVKA